VANKIERLEYATATSPMGPFTWRGVLLDESASGCWTVHHSVVEYQGQWYLFYHDRDLSPSFDKNRSIRADKLFFEADGSIRKVVPTLRGVGRVAAGSEIQIDRYSATSPQGIAISFLDDSNPYAGWKTKFGGENRGCDSMKSTSLARSVRSPCGRSHRPKASWKSTWTIRMALCSAG
jgi:hypothetical protein